CTASVMGRPSNFSPDSRVASGKVTLTLCDISGVVTMKMISITSMTSTRGTTLGSVNPLPPSLALNAIGDLPQRRRSALRADVADPRAGGEEVVQIVGEGVELGVGGSVLAIEGVVRDHRRDGHGQTDGGHDQRLAD